VPDKIRIPDDAILKAPIYTTCGRAAPQFFERKFMLKRTSIWVLALVTIALTACNTVQGVGKDVQKAGEKLEDAAKKK
jgi:predicted small secreted protein